MYTIDKIIDEIGFGKFNLRIYIVAFLLTMNFLSVVNSLGLTLPSMAEQWNLTSFQISFLGSFDYFCQFFGSLSSSYTSNKFGRRKPLIITLSIWVLSLIIQIYCTNFYLYCLFRGIMDACALKCSMLAYILLSETLPKKMRGAILGSLEFIVVFGSLQVICIMMKTHTSLEIGNVKLFLSFLLINMVFTLFLVILLCEESPRYLCIHHRIDESITILKKMIVYNKSKFDFNEEIQKSFRSSIENVHCQMAENDIKLNDYNSLFSGSYKIITVTLFFVWFSHCLAAAGIDFIFPLTLGKIYQEAGIELIYKIFYLNLVILPFLVPAVLAIDYHMFGRKKILAFSLGLLGLSSVFISINLFSSFFVWLLFAKIGISINFMASSMFSAEIYPTSLRMTALGIFGAFGRIGSFLAPSLSIYLSESHIFLPFFFYGVLCIGAGIMLLRLKYETLTGEMDKILENENGSKEIELKETLI